MKKQTTGREHLGKLAPKFAALNDDVLFGEVWSREDRLSARDRSMVTIAALFSAGLYPQLKAHLALGKEHGVTKDEAVALMEDPRQPGLKARQPVVKEQNRLAAAFEEQKRGQKTAT